MPEGLPKIIWDHVPEPKKWAEEGALHTQTQVEVVYMLGDKEQKSHYFTNRASGEWEFLSGCYLRKNNAEFVKDMKKAGHVLKEGSETDPDFDRMVAYLLDNDGKRIAIIEEKTDFRFPVHY